MKWLLDYQILEIINLGLGVFEEVAVPTCIILVENAYHTDNVVKMASLSQKSVYSGVLTGLNHSPISQSTFRSNHEFSFDESNSHLIHENEEHLEAILV